MGYLNKEIINSPGGVPTNLMHIDYLSGTIESNIHIVSLEDNGYHINYAPALQISSYGHTQEEARDMMINIVIPDLFENILKIGKPATLEFLSKLGWSAVDRESKDFKNSAFVDRDGILQNFNLPQDTKIQDEVLTLA
ncbi:MAG: hypothetical protein EOO88_16485 [Pedobacter sp.]|nr:MAG: hypothetical protein EOO88_16485 [Pedobacter sp.]